MLAFFLKLKKWFRDRIEYVKIVKIWIVWKNYNTVTCTHLIQKSEILNNNLIRQSINKLIQFWFGIMVNKFVFRLIKLCFPVFSFSPYNFSTLSSSEVTIDRKAKKKKPTFFLDWRLSVYCKITTSLKDCII